MASKPTNHVPRLRAAVIGTGKISEAHLQFLSANPAVELAGVCDLSAAMAQYAVTRFGAGRAFASAADLLRDIKPDVVHVLTPPHTHVPLATQCLEAGAHVIVEKPIAPTNAGLHELWSLARSRGKWVVEDHNYRFNEPILAIERLHASGRLGEIRDVEVRMSFGLLQQGSRYADRNLPHPTHKMPAGPIHDFITHFAYLMLRFLPDYDRVIAAWSKHEPDSMFKYDDLDALLLGGRVHGRIRFTAHTAPDAFTVTVRGSEGSVETDLFHPYLRTNLRRPVVRQLNPLADQFVVGCGMVRSSVIGFKDKVLQKTPLEGVGTFLERTYVAFREGTEPPVTFDDMDRASKLVDALLSEDNQIGKGRAVAGSAVNV